jgi:hypothetical protein
MQPGLPPTSVLGEGWSIGQTLWRYREGDCGTQQMRGTRNSGLHADTAALGNSKNAGMLWGVLLTRENDAPDSQKVAGLFESKAGSRSIVVLFIRAGEHQCWER